MRVARRLGTGLLLIGLGVVSGSEAQPPPLSSACQTQFGVCLAPKAPVGAPCTCGYGDPGRMIFAPMQQQQQRPSNFPQQNRLTTACGTPFGVCQMQFPAPVGAPCTCYGPRGPDKGQMIGVGPR